jgi:hypothetical protein
MEKKNLIAISITASTVFLFLVLVNSGTGRRLPQDEIHAYN